MPRIARVVISGIPHHVTLLAAQGSTDNCNRLMCTHLWMSLLAGMWEEWQAGRRMPSAVASLTLEQQKTAFEQQQSDTRAIL